MLTGPSASSAPARIGSVAFLAPEIRTSPCRGMPPLICSLSMRALTGALAACRPLLGREGLDGQRMDFPPHALTQCAIDELVACEGAQPLKMLAHQDSRVMRVIVR